MPDSTSGLVQKFMESTKPQIYKTSLKFRVLDQIVFKIDINSNNSEETHEQLHKLIASAVSSATNVVINRNKKN